MRNWCLTLVACAALTAVGPGASAAGVPMTREQVVDLARQGVDPSVLASLVARDCVDFDINPANVVELTKALPKEVVKAIFDCRAHAPVVAPAVSPAAAPPPSPAREFGPAMTVCLPAGEGDLTVRHGTKNSCYGTLTADNSGLSFVTATCKHHDGTDDFNIAWTSLDRLCIRQGPETYTVEIHDRTGATHRVDLDPSVLWGDPAWTDTYEKRKSTCQADIARLLERIREREPEVDVQVRCP